MDAVAIEIPLDDKKIDSKEIVAIIQEFSAEYWLLTGGFIFLALITTILQIVAVNKLTANLQKGLSDGDIKRSMWSLFYMMAVMVLAFGINYTYDTLENRLFPLFTAYAEKRLIRTILEKNAVNVDSNTDPNLFREILIRTSSSAAHLYREFLVTVIPNTLVIGTMFIYLTYLNWRYGIIFIVAGILIAGVAFLSQNRVMACAKYHEQLAKGAEWRAFDVMKNMPVVAARNMVSMEVDDLGTRYDVVAEDKIQYRQMVDNLAYIIQLISYSAVFIILWLSIWDFGQFMQKQPKQQKDKSKQDEYARSILVVIAVLMSARVRLQTLSKSQINMTDSIGKYGFINNKVNELNARIVEQGEVLEPMDNTIEFSNLQVSYHDPVKDREIPVLRGLDLNVEANECLVIRGHSGCGKSTLMNALTRKIDTNSGTITIGNTPVEEYALEQGLRRFIVFVAANQGILDRSIEENMLYGCPYDEAERAKVTATKLWSEFKDPLFLNKDITDRAGPNGGSELSTGQKMWVNLANLFILSDTKNVAVLDEPTQGLDPETKDSILKMLTRLRDERNMTMLVITHDEDCAHIGDRVALMDQGVIQSISSPQIDDTPPGPPQAIA